MHPFAPPFRLPSPADFEHSSSPSSNSLRIGRRPRPRAHLSASTKSPQTLRHVRTVHLCPPALPYPFNLGIVLWFRVALVHSPDTSQ
ncbi:hypothetical protein M404DRAFT_999748 [Pisolithus tinctorius Marx 270]|uniref:Uncharacterized protein n=1 Tax=Pisolithus tinctorius Marx 270 TaxID=870435 RepID=A0A0C3K7M4_PISTI|nr:hypothetical protein M404DRAFT_999748 [Pisolithus tinctorius Marx 270]